MELLFELPFLLIGAFVGVIWPPKSPEWAKWQRRGLVCMLLMLLSFGTAMLIAWLTDGSPLVWPLTIAGFILLIAYLIIGNICRHYHES